MLVDIRTEGPERMQACAALLSPDYDCSCFSENDCPLNSCPQSDRNHASWWLVRARGRRSKGYRKVGGTAAAQLGQQRCGSEAGGGSARSYDGAMDLRLAVCVVIGFGLGLGVASLGFEIAWGGWANQPWLGVGTCLVLSGLLLSWDEHRRKRRGTR
jgi:hypothetical protein